MSGDGHHTPSDGCPVPEQGTPEREALIEAIAGRVAGLVHDGAVRRLVGTEAAAAFLDVPASWLASQARNGLAPCRRLGKYVRFDLAELRAWVDATAASGPVTGCGPVSPSPVGHCSSAGAAGRPSVVPSVVPSVRERRAA